VISFFFSKSKIELNVRYKSRYFNLLENLEVDTLTFAMKLSGESNIETMRGNEISTIDKVYWHLSSLRSKGKRETSKTQTSQKKQGGQTTHFEYLKLKHESEYLGNSEEFY